MRIAEAALLVAAACVVAGPAVAAERHRFEVPAGALGEALIRFGEQAGISIGALDPRAASARSRGLSGRFTVEQGLGRLLAGSGFTFVFADGSTIRIVGEPAARGLSQPSPAAPVPSVAAADIVVIASKRDTPLDSFAGQADIFEPQSNPTAADGARGTEAIIARLPTIASTHLGAGRNKLFVRGVADSSFTGPTQATVGQYLGDVRLNYDAPDPDIELYDIRRIEVLEGPQGTLYGAGSLGGIIRIVPNAPDSHRASATIDVGATATRSGDDGRDAAAMLNLPIVRGAVGLRLVGYTSIDGGYIDDVRRGLSDVNRTRTTGGRAALRIAPGDGWTIDLGWMRQDITSADSQYAERGLPPLSRASTIAQPFDNDYSLYQAVVRKSWGRTDLVSATGLVEHSVSARYDATGFDGMTGPAALEEANRITLISHETRLSRRYRDGGGWIVGASFVSNVDRIARKLGDPNEPPPTGGVRNRIGDGALFGEMTRRVTATLYATAGGRIAYARLSGEPIGGTDSAFEPVRDEFRVLPSAALVWRPDGKLTWFARYQEGFRAGGLALGDGTEQGVRRFRADTIRTVETGLRYGRRYESRFSAAATFSWARWENIQADLIDMAGQPYTANIGDGRVLSFEASARWEPVAGLDAEAALFVGDSVLKHPAPGFEGSDEGELPNIPATGARGSVGYRTRIGSDASFSVEASLRYVGRSRLGVGPLLELPQGDYLDSALGVRLDRGGFGFSLDVANLADVRGNRFSLGNVFGVTEGRQITPLRPRSVRMGLHAAF